MFIPGLTGAPQGLQCPVHWSRAVVLIDMNAFFASIEQQDNPSLQGQPVAVTNGEQGTCIITCSYEARAFGIKTGMRFREAKARCPHLIQRPAQPKRYAHVSRHIMAALKDITPDIEIFSVDEAFLDVTHCQKLYGSAARVGLLAKQAVFEASGLLCSVGVSGDKTTAKYAAKLHKPNGFTVIPPWESAAQLANVPVTELCGIARGIGGFLAKHGVHTCGEMSKLPVSVLSRRFGNLGRRIWFMCQGQDMDPVSTVVPDPKTLGHGKVIPPNTTDPELIKMYFMHMSEKLGARLRHNHLQAQHFYIGLRSFEWGWLGCKAALPIPTNDGRTLYQLCCQQLPAIWQGEGVSQVQVTALDPLPLCHQGDFFEPQDPSRQAVNGAVDGVNHRFGEFAVSPARLLNRSSMPNVISPAWKPSGPRQSTE